jgi:hypothetical protein
MKIAVVASLREKRSFLSLVFLGPMGLLQFFEQLFLLPLRKLHLNEGLFTL